MEMVNLFSPSGGAENRVVIMTGPITGKYQGFTVTKWLPDLVYEYYRLSGRHERTGRPFKETLIRLGLEEFVEWSQPEK